MLGRFPTGRGRRWPVLGVYIELAVALVGLDMSSFTVRHASLRAIAIAGNVASLPHAVANIL